jgi:hypothetical protein
MGGNDSYGWRNSLEEDGIQLVQGSDKYSVSPVCGCGCEQLFPAERNRIPIAPWFVVPIDTAFNFLRKLAGDNQNWFLRAVSPISELELNPLPTQCALFRWNISSDLRV